MPRKALSVGPFKCCICKKGFTRRCTIQDPHFSSCVRRNGNPRDLPWDAHPSCWTKGSGGPSGTMAPGARRSLQKGAEVEEEGEEEDKRSRKMVALRVPSKARVHAYQTRAAGMKRNLQEADELKMEDETSVSEEVSSDKEAELSDMEEGLVDGGPGASEAPATGDETPIRSITPLASQPTTPNNRSPVHDDGVADSEASRSGSLSKQCQLWPASYNEQGYPRRQFIPRLLSRMAMNQIANISILSSRQRAGVSDIEAMSMWDTWHSLLPSYGKCRTQRPAIGCDQKARQQAVVWMAQDTYAALLQKTNTLAQQLKLVALYRDVSRGFGDAAGVAKIHDLLVDALGEGGPLLLT